MASGGESSAKPVKIAFLEYLGADYQTAQIKGLNSVVKPAGGSVTTFSANFDPQKQVKQCQDAVSSGRYNAIVLAPVDPASAVPCAAVAKAANIPVGTIETAVGKDPYSLQPQVPGVVSVVGAPLASEVDADAELVGQACGSADPCKVIAEITTPDDRFTNDVVKGVQAKLGSKIKVVQKIVSQYDPGAITKALPDALSAHKDANVFFAASDQSALAAIPALKQAGLVGKVKLTGRGGSSEGVAAVADGSLFGTTGNWPQQYGEFLAKGLTEAVNGKPVTNVSLDMLKTDSPTIVTKQSVAQFKSEWGTRS